MNNEFVSVADFGLEHSAGVFARGYSDYFVKIPATPAMLLGMARGDGVDLTVSRILVRDGRPVAGGLIARRGWTCRLAGMAVVPEARRTGAGRELLRQLLAESAARSERAMVLEVIEQNIPAVALYEKSGFRRVRRLCGWQGPANPAPVTDLREVDLREVAAAVARHGLADLPWQVAAETIAHLNPSSRGYRLGPAWLAVTPVPDGPVSVRALVVEKSARGQGAAKTLLRAAMAEHPDAAWRAGAVFPEEMEPVFLSVGLARTELTQWQMARPLVQKET